MKITIDSQHLRVFVTIARTLNMGRAAEELKLTPSAVSHCLKALETDLGAPRRLSRIDVERFVCSDSEQNGVFYAQTLRSVPPTQRQVKEIDIGILRQTARRIAEIVERETNREIGGAAEILVLETRDFRAGRAMALVR